MNVKLLFIPVLFGLAACQNSGPLDLTANRAYEYDRQAIPTVYCYATLGQADCFDRPLKGQSYRLINYVGPTPSQVGSSSASGHSK